MLSRLIMALILERKDLSSLDVVPDGSLDLLVGDVLVML
jgi:hypothetical protein